MPPCFEPGSRATCPRPYACAAMYRIDFPRDLAMVKLLQYFEFNRGNSPAMLRAALKVLDQHMDVPYVHGMAAFAYEQCHLLNEAEQAARTALALKRKEPWAQHALAHVMLTRGRIDEGARFLEGLTGTWTGLNSFMLTHLWWHLALFKLSQGRFADVLEIYDRQCWGVAKDYSQDQIGAVSLLARMEMAGIDVGPRWQELGEPSGRARPGHGAALPHGAISLRAGAGGARGGGLAARRRCGHWRVPRRRMPARYGARWRCPPAKGFTRTRAVNTTAAWRHLEPRHAAPRPRSAEAMRSAICSSRSCSTPPSRDGARSLRSRCSSCGAAPILKACRSIPHWARCMRSSG